MKGRARNSRCFAIRDIAQQIRKVLYEEQIARCRQSDVNTASSNKQLAYFNTQRMVLQYVLKAYFE